MDFELVKVAVREYDCAVSGWRGPSAMIHAQAIAAYIRAKAPSLNPEIVSVREAGSGLVDIASIRSLYTERPYAPRRAQLGSFIAEIQRHVKKEWPTDVTACHNVSQ